MKYKVGDRVRVISTIPEGKREFFMEGSSSYNSINDDMEELLGTVVTISGYVHEQYRIEEDYQCWLWTDEMFEGLAEEKLDPDEEAESPFKEPWEELF